MFVMDFSQDRSKKHFFFFFVININGLALDLREMNHDFFFLLFDLFIKLLCMAAARTKSGYKISIIEIFPFFYLVF